MADLTYKENKKSRFLFISYNTLHDPANSTYLAAMKTEEDIKNCVGIMIDFIKQTGLPLLDRFEDLREVDLIVNGTKPWETDWQKPYVLGGNFYEKRLIIAKLAGNPNFHSLVDFNFKTLEKLSAESGSPFVYNRNDLNKPLPALVKILEEVRPLYQ